jgi:hypothetical protein
MPMAGVYCDGEIGPAVEHGLLCGVQWSGSKALASQHSSKSELQGFTTIVAVLSG